MYGPEDRRTLACKQNLALNLAHFNYMDESDWREEVDEMGERVRVAGELPVDRAVWMLKEVLDARLRVDDGTEWDKIDYTQMRLAEVLIEKVQPPQLEEGEAILREVMVSRLAVMGPDDRSIGDLHYVIGVCLWQQKRNRDAVEEFRACWKERERVLGVDHTDTLVALDMYRRVRGRSCFSCSLL